MPPRKAPNRDPGPVRTNTAYRRNAIDALPANQREFLLHLKTTTTASAPNLHHLSLIELRAEARRLAISGANSLNRYDLETRLHEHEHGSQKKISRRAVTGANLTENHIRAIRTMQHKTLFLGAVHIYSTLLHERQIQDFAASRGFPVHADLNGTVHDLGWDLVHRVAFTKHGNTLVPRDQLRGAYDDMERFAEAEVNAYTLMNRNGNSMPGPAPKSPSKMPSERSSKSPSKRSSRSPSKSLFRRVATSIARSITSSRALGSPSSSPRRRSPSSSPSRGSPRRGSPSRGSPAWTPQNNIPQKKKRRLK